MTSTAPSLETEQRIGTLRGPTRLHILLTAVAVGGSLLGLVAAGQWCRNAGVEVALERRWTLRLLSGPIIGTTSRLPNGQVECWTEYGHGFVAGPIRVLWPDSLMSEPRRTKFTYALWNELDSQLFERLEPEKAVSSCSTLIAAAPHALFYPLAQTTTCYELQATAYAARGNYAAALTSIEGARQWAKRNAWTLLLPSSDGAEEYRMVQRCRIAAWKLLHQRGPAAEATLRASLYRRTPLLAPALTSNYPNTVAAAARVEIRLTLAELLLRQGRTAEAKPLLKEVLETELYGKEHATLRLARAYLHHPGALSGKSAGEE